MYGYQPPAARRLAPPPEQYADGGLVARMKSADAGPAAFGSRGLSQLRDMVPKVAAMGYPQQAAAPAPAPAPVSDPRAAQLMAMIPQMEAMGFKQKPQMLARGGMVRGPGTGTSDSIPDEAEPDTFIMPADSTAAIGPSALEKMGTVPVRLSDGEFKIPPEQVMALGAAVLKLYKDATHTPVNGEDGGQTDAEVEDDDGARGFNPADRMAQMPEQMYADGGMVDSNRPRSFGDAAAVANDPTTTQVRTSAVDSFGRPPAAAPVAATAPALGSNLAAVTRMGSFTDPRSTMYDSNPYAASNAAKMAASGQSSRATVEAGMAPAPQPATASNSFGDASAATRDAGVTQVAGNQPGRGTVSTVPAQPVAPRPPAAPALAAAPATGFQTAAQRMAAPTPAPAPVQAAAPAAPMGWQARQDQRSAEVAAASITNRPEWSRAQPRRFADGGMVEDDLQKRLMQIPSSAPPGWTGGGGGSGGGGGAGGVTGSWDAPQTAPAPAPAPTPPAGALTRAASMSAPAPAVQAMGELPSNPNGGQVSTQSMGAADGLARRGAADALAQMPSAPQTTVQAPMVRHSGNDWQARKDLENARTSALSITNRPEWSNTGMNRFRGGQAGPSTDVAAYNAMLSNDLALRGAQPGLDQAAMRENAENQRSSLRERGLAAQALASERGAMDRTLITERGNNTRAGITALASTEAARLRAQQEGKAPPGYRWKADGGMEPIPGGPAASKVADDAKTRESGFDGSRQAIGTINRLLASPGRQGATGSWNLNRFIPGNQSADFAAEVETLKAQTFLPMIQQLRGMGALSNAEGDKINAAVGALNFNMSEPAFAESLGRIRDQLGSALQRSGVDTKDLANWGLDEPTSTATKPSGNAPAPSPAVTPTSTMKIDTQQAFAELPSGSRFIAPDGTTRIKP